MSTREQMTKALDEAGLKREARYVKEVGMPSPSQLDSLLADKSSGPLLRPGMLLAPPSRTVHQQVSSTPDDSTCSYALCES